MTSTKPDGPVTGVAAGSLGTGTAVTDETTLLETPELPEPAATAQSAGFLHAARQPDPALSRESIPSGEEPIGTTAVRAAPPAPAASAAPPVLAAPAARAARAARRDPYRPIGIALAAILVALAGVALLSNGAGAPTDAAAPSRATATPGTAGAGDDEDGGDGNGIDEGGGGGGNGNGNGHDGGDDNGHGNGNGNGNGGDGPG